MIIEDTVFAIGSAHAGLTALIGSGSSCRLYPAAQDPEPALPYVIFTKGDPMPIEGYYSDTGWFKTEIAFEAHAATAREAALVMAQVRAAFARYKGTVGGVAKVDDVHTIGNGSAYYDEELAHYCEELEFEISHTE